jgi:hypothetical protein
VTRGAERAPPARFSRLGSQRREARGRPLVGGGDGDRIFGRCRRSGARHSTSATPLSARASCPSPAGRCRSSTRASRRSTGRCEPAQASSTCRTWASSGLPETVPTTTCRRGSPTTSTGSSRAGPSTRSSPTTRAGSSTT